MRGKRGFLRIVEVFVAILIIGGVMLFIYVEKVQKPQQEDFIYQTIRSALRDIANDEDYREAVLKGCDGCCPTCSFPSEQDYRDTLETRLREVIPIEYEFRFKICKLESACGLVGGLPAKEVFSEEVSVSVTLDSDDFEPKKIRLFVWEK